MNKDMIIFKFKKKKQDQKRLNSFLITAILKLRDNIDHPAWAVN